MTRAAIYARVSSQAQKESHTIENQLRTLPPFVLAKGWTIAGTYIDDGRSAKTGKLAARTGFADMIRDAERGLFDVVVVVDIDRLTRTADMIERSQILGPFQRLGIRIVTPSGGDLDMRSMLGELYVTLQAQFAAEENRKRAERIKAGKLRAIAEGRKPAGPTPFGLAYSRATGLWSIDEAAAAIVREIFERVAGGESCVMIGDDLARREGIPAPRTGWTRAAVYRIVRVRTACGEWSADKARGAVIAVPAIVTEDLWRAATAELLGHKKRGLRRTKHVYLLEGLATCSECGSRIMIRSACGSIGKRTGEKSPAAYVCRGRQLRTCKATIVKCRDIDDRVWAAICDEIVQPELLEAVERVRAERAADTSDWSRDIDAAESQIARLGKVEEAFMARFRRGQISDGSLDKELAALNRDRAFYRRQLDTARGAVTSNEHARTRLGSAASLVHELRAALPKAAPEQRRALLLELAHDGGITMVGDRVHLDLRVSLQEDTEACRAEAAPHLGLVNSTDYRIEHEATLRIRRVA